MTPTRFVTLVNVARAVLGFAVGIYVARILGPDQLGVTAVITGLNASFLAFFDVRLSDISGKMFYRVSEAAPGQEPAYQAGVLWMGILGNAVIAGLMALISGIFGIFLIGFFTDTPVHAWWIAAGAAAGAMSATSGGIMFLSRLSNDFYVLGSWRFAGTVGMSVLMASVLTSNATLSGFFVALLVSNIFNVMLSFFAWAHICGKRARLPLLNPDWRAAFHAYRKNWQLMWYGNLMGYTKMLQRSADVLFVAFFANDRETGLYKLARQVIDQGLGVLQEAVYEVHYPQLLKMFTEGAHERFRTLAGRLMKTAGVATGLMVVGELILLPFLIPALFGPEFVGAEGAMILLTATFFYLVGFHPWLWAIFVGSGELRSYTKALYQATFVQYAVMSLAFVAAGPSAAAAMVGMVALYVWLSFAGIFLARRSYPTFVPFGDSHAAIAR